MPHRELLLEVLRKYSTGYSSEKSFIEETIAFVESNEDCFERSNTKGHINGSCFVLSPDSKKTLLTHHKKLNRWLQLGGHADGDSNIWDVSLKEALEESGIQDISLVMEDIFDIDIHTIPANTTKGEGEHLHYDIRFLLRAPTEEFVVSDESHNLKWVNSEELEEMAQKKEIGTSIQRMHDKWLKKQL